MVFEGFESDLIGVGEASVFVRYGGAGLPVLLLHGHPRTSATWHRVAPLLREQGFTAGTRRTIGPPGCRSGARPWCCGHGTTISKRSMVTRWRSGVAGQRPSRPPRRLPPSHGRGSTGRTSQIPSRFPSRLKHFPQRDRAFAGD